MPDRSGRRAGACRAHPRRGGFLAAVAYACFSSPPPPTPRSSIFRRSIPPSPGFTGLNQHDVAGLALTLGILLFAVVTAVMLVRTRSRAAQAEIAAREEIIALKADVDRAHALLLAEPQIIVAWAAGDDKPEIFGDTTMVTPVSAPHRVLAFGTWLEPAQARAMERRSRRCATTAKASPRRSPRLSGRPMEAEGRAIGGRAVLRLRDVERRASAISPTLDRASRSCSAKWIRCAR